MMQRSYKIFILRSLLAMLPVAAFVVLYALLDPFKVVHHYDGISVAPGDTIERIPNKRYVALEGLQFYSNEHHYDSFIFGSSISTNFTVDAWSKHLPADACIYHFTAGAQTLTGIRDELKYLIEHGYNVKHAMLVMEEQIFSRPTSYDEMPFVPHYKVSPDISWLHFHLMHFNAFRDFYMFLYHVWPTKRVVDKLLEDGKLSHIQDGRNEITNEDSNAGLDSVILHNPSKYYAEMEWLTEMVPLPNPKPLSINAQAEKTLREIAALLTENQIDYLVIVPPLFRGHPLSSVDHAVLCEIMGEQNVHDFSSDSVLIHDLHSYYDGQHILTYRCKELIDRCYQEATSFKQGLRHY